MRCIFLVVTLVAAASAQTSTPELLSPEAAVRMALEKNYSLILAHDQTETATLNRKTGIGPFLPEASASVNHSGQLDSPVKPQTKLGASLNLVIFDGFQSVHAYQRLKSEEKAATLSEKAAMQTTVESVLGAYYTVVVEKRRVNSIRELMAVSEERSKLAEAKSELGAGSRLEQLQSEADFNTDSSSYLSEVVAFQQAKVQLNQLLARDPILDFDVMDSISLPDSLPLAAWRQGLPETNLSLQQAKASQNAAASAVKEAQAEWWPDLNAGVAYNAWPSALNPNTTPGLHDGATYSVGLTVPLFDQFQARRAVGVARLQLRQGETQLRQQEEDVRSQFEIAGQQFSTGLRQVALETRNLEVARLQAEAAREQYRVGAATPLVFRDAQQKLLAAESGWIASRQNAKKAELALKRLAGMLVE